MTEQDLRDINWFAAFAGFGVDLIFSLLVGSVVVAILLTLKGASLEEAEGLPTDVNLAYQIVGVLGALVGGFVAGILARRRGSLHGALASVIGLFVFFCSFALVEDPAFSVGDLGFIVLNLVAAGYAGAAGERFRARRESAG